MLPHGRSIRCLSAVLALTLAVAACSTSGDSAPIGSQGPPPPGSVRVPVRVPAGMAAAPFDTPRYLNVPEGWTASVYARIPSARFMSPTPDGELLVSQPGAGAVHLVRRQADGTARVTEFIGGLKQPHDIVFAELAGGTWVFIAEADRVVRYPYRKGDERAQPGQTVVDGLPDTSLPELRGKYNHVLKNIAVHRGTLYVSIASTCNACIEDTVADRQRGTIYTYDAAARNTGRKLYAWGLRNAEGLAFVPGTADLWVVVNNRDNTLVPDDRDVDGDGRSDKGKRITKYVDDNPPEPFTRVVDGGFYGWPFCNANIDKGTRDMPYDRDYELNRDGRAADCAEATPMNVGLQAHTAPLGLTFTQGTPAPDLGAVIALHGSWNRSTPSGYKVINVPWTAGGPGAERDLFTGWLDASTGKAWGRPVDVAIEPDGALLVSDDVAGAVFRLKRE